MIDKRVGTVEAALEGLTDGAVVMISGFGGAGMPVTLVRGLEATGARDLTLIVNSARFVETTTPKIFGEGRVRRLIASAARGRDVEPSTYERQWQAGELDIEIAPQGSFAERIRAGGAGIPAFYTPTGVGTPLAAGKEARDFNGRACVLETALTADVALLRGHVADRWGNVGFHGSQANFGPAMATAARIAVVEVASIEDEPLDPARIDLPGIYVSRVLLSEGGR